MTDSPHIASIDASDMENLYSAISRIIDETRQYVRTAIDLSMVQSNYEIGRLIVESSQHGDKRAPYGARIIESLADKLTQTYGKGYSARNLKLMRRFYLTYAPSEIGQNLSAQSQREIAETAELSFSTQSPQRTSSRTFQLSWSHYVFLMGIDNSEERQFYEVEAVKHHWSLKELRRQFDSALYERLAIGRGGKDMARLSTEGHIVETATDIVKDPYVLEFLGLPEKACCSENELEARIITHLQEFLLELGTGFAFVGRQVRFTYDDAHFFVDLVFYNRLLRCFVLFDLKIGELRHQDIGQMQMYVNYYDREVKLEDENPTIGILLCRKKNDTIVEMTLPIDNQQIYASKYETVLPSKEQLRRLLKEFDEDGATA